MLVKTWMSIVGSAEGAITVESEKKQISAPIPFAESKYAEWEQITFSDYANLPDGIYDTANAEDFCKTAFYEGTLAGKVFSGDVTFSEATNYLNIGGISDPWYGLYLISSYGGDPTVLHLLAGGEHVITTQALGTGETTFAGTKFNLKLSYELVDLDEDTNPDSLKLGVWINNLLYKYIDITDYTQAIGGGLGIFTPVAGSSVTLTSNKVQKAEPVDFEDTEYKNWQQISFSSFGVEDGYYEAEYPYYGGEINDVVFHGNVMFGENYSSLILGDRVDEVGLTLFSQGGVLYLGMPGRENVRLGTEFAGTQLIGTRFNLKVSYDLLDSNEDGEDDTLKLGVWINDKLYDDQYIEVTDYEVLLKSGMVLYGMDVSSVELKVPETIKFVNSEYKSWQQVTFSDYGLEDGYYATAYPSFAGALTDTVFNGNVEFLPEYSSLILGNQIDEVGLGLTTLSGALYLKIPGKADILIDRNIAGTQLVEAEFNLKISYDVFDSNEDGTDDTLKIGVWINDKLYNNKYIEVTDYEVLLKTGMVLYGMRVDSTGIKTLSTKLKRITFADFGIKDGSYTYVGDLAASGTYSGNLEGVVICGDVLFSSKPATLFVGGKSDVKQGLSITSGADGNLILKIGNDTYTLTPDVAGTELVGKPFNLQLSYQIDNNSLKLGVWVNGKLYDNKYIYVIDNYADYLTGQLAVYPESEGASLKLTSEKAEVLNKYFEKISFADYGIGDGTYSGEDNMKVGYYMGGYDGKVFSGDVIFSEHRTDIWIGGVDDPWYGMGFLSGYEGDTTTLRFWADGREYILTPEIAGTTLVGKSVNLKLSYELVDSDNGGKKDVLKLGIWFNNKLYNNQYIYVTNYEQYMGPYMGLYTAWTDSAITVASDLSVDYVALGSRRAPSPNTGDVADVVFYIGLAVVSVAAILVLGKKQRLE